jgi:hypothetical protein
MSHRTGVQSWKGISGSFEKNNVAATQGGRKEGRKGGGGDEEGVADRSNSKARSLARMPGPNPVT